MRCTMPARGPMGRSWWSTVPACRRPCSKANCSVREGRIQRCRQRKQGLVEAANGGTLFLDEMGDVPLGMQVKLLRLMESGTYRRVGGIELQRGDFRLVAATHRP